MKRYSFVLILLCISLSACLFNTAKFTELSRSLAAWRNLKSDEGGHYQYTSSFGSFAGFGWTTTLKVLDDEIVERRYEAYQIENGGEKKVTETWVEVGDEVGQRDEGAPPRTVEEVYGVCRDEVLSQSTFSNDIYLEFDSQGLLESCVYVPKGCADDCSTGVNISDLKFLSDQGSQVRTIF